MSAGVTLILDFAWTSQIHPQSPLCLLPPNVIDGREHERPWLDHGRREEETPCGCDVQVAFMKD